MDGISLNAKIREVSERNWEDWLFKQYGDLDFTAWDRYRTWLLTVLPGGEKWK